MPVIQYIDKALDKEPNGLSCSFAVHNSTQQIYQNSKCCHLLYYFICFSCRLENRRKSIVAISLQPKLYNMMKQLTMKVFIACLHFLLIAASDSTCIEPAKEMNGIHLRVSATHVT